MGAAAISVQQLRLRADRQASAPALRARIEDGLRVSTLPPALAHRYVLLRRLRLTLPREASAQSLALQLEREWRAIESLAQPMATASAEAVAVWAPDEAEARLLRVRRWLREQEAEAWFWRRLLPAAQPSMPLAQRLLLALSEDFDATGASPPEVRSAEADFKRRAWREITAAGKGPEVLAQAPAPLRAALLAIHGDAADVHALRWQPMHETAWPTRFHVAPLDRFRTTAAPRIASSPPWASTEAEAELPRGATLPIEQLAAIGPALIPNVAVASMPAATPATAEPARSLQPGVIARSLVEAPPLVQGAATAWAGLWFLLPLLQRLGLEDEPDAVALFAAVLCHAATHLHFDAPASAWIEQVVARAAVDAATTKGPAWWRRARIACMRQTRLPLRRVVQRAGQVWLSPHRVDVMLPLTGADIRIRRAGYDIDPGYVSWLDCVIHFHYR